MNRRIQVTVFFLLYLCAARSNSFAQAGSQDWINLFVQSYYTGFRKLPPLKPNWLSLSESSPVEHMQPLSYGLDALSAMFEATDSVSYLDDEIKIVNNIIAASRVTENIADNTYPFKDKYKGWIVTDSLFAKEIYHSETVLSEIYFFQYVTRLLKDIRNKESIYQTQRYKIFYEQTLDFVETNIWDKWVNRGIRYSKDRYNFLLLGRTHMSSHWAYIAAELAGLATNSNKKADYLQFVNVYNSQLQHVFYTYDTYVSWSQTFAHDSAKQITKDNVQDVSHGNLVVSYIVEAYDLGLWKDTDIVRRIINTLKDKLWSPDQCLFRDNMDGTMFMAGKSGSVGSFQADGFVKLTRYDSSLVNIYTKFIACSPLLERWHQYGQLFANLALSEKILKAAQ
jgi:hypothetical protein